MTTMGAFGDLPPTANIVTQERRPDREHGQLWFGTDGESSPDTRVHLTINNGHLDLTGGEIPIENGEMTAWEESSAIWPSFTTGANI